MKTLVSFFILLMFFGCKTDSKEPIPAKEKPESVMAGAEKLIFN